MSAWMDTGVYGTDSKVGMIGCNSSSWYYDSERGIYPHLFPGGVVEFQRRTRRAQLSDFYAKALHKQA